MKRLSKLFFSLLFLGGTLSGYGQMKVMTYNIKYANENDGENSWSFRKEHLRNQVAFYEPDILGVQEAQLVQLKFLLQGLPDYDFSGVGRDGQNKGEYTAIFYNKKKYQLIEEGTFWLSETPEIVSKGWDAAYPRICTYILLKDLVTGDKFFVFNTHFDHVGDRAREESTRLIISKIDELNKENLPFILMGDFNLEPETSEIKLLSGKMDDSKRIAKLVFGPEGTFNTYNFTEPVTRRIDYIFTSQGDFEILKYGVLSDSYDLKYPSDHLPVLVQLKLK
ncbi:endonuclease/exonuclease/phosphatase family protein [Salinimicrobium gaetbulicola]|uniref:Endonuclease/exonuclease/phosphatase family protein n=1 Tax=Salinimicrobium gaetbulicola TaxID=999702 RepID=A0ABW3IE37_9FLAO